MSIKIVNTCQKTYKPDPENTVKHILERIPEKFLAGIGEVRLFDAVNEGEEREGIQYVWKPDLAQDAVIEIYMDNMLSGIPFFSIFTFNLMFVFALNDHIKRLKRQTEDSEILSFPLGRVPYNWLYYGIWNPIIIFFKVGNYLISRIPGVSAMIFKMARIRERKEQ